MKSTWIKLNLPYGPCLDDDFNEIDSFDKRNLNKPGTLIETEYGQFLIGHINPNIGICDDCQMFSSETVVLKYKILIDNLENHES